MRLNFSVALAALATVFLLAGCKKSTQAPAPSTSAQNADQASSAAAPADPSATAAPDQPVPAGSVPTDPKNPSIKAPPPGPPMVVRGVTVNVDAAEKALQTAPYRVQVILGNVRYSLRYEDFNTVLAHYQQILRDPAVTEAQKGAIAPVMEQVKQAAASPPR